VVLRCVRRPGQRCASLSVPAAKAVLSRSFFHWIDLRKVWDAITSDNFELFSESSQPHSRGPAKRARLDVQIYIVILILLVVLLGLCLLCLALTEFASSLGIFIIEILC
jgi:hypothetical protein